MRTCPNCHQDHPDEMDFCPRDATPLPLPINATQINISAGLARRYRILRRIGEGGMGTVFLAEQLGVGNRPVALKILRRKLLEDPDFLQRFQDEASSTGRIRHQNVVTVYECGQSDDGSPYIAMEYLEGESLRQALKRRSALPLLEAVEILQQAARGLNAAHKLGIIHRDLKPDNIFLTHDDDGQLLVKIVDFGIAKMRESTSHTMVGLAVGTPAYMSVEQASGMPSDELDGRSDIYSLGIVAYELITGRVPFQADTPLAYLKKHLIEPPTSITLSRPDLHISPQLDQVVMKALQKERTDRYPTAPDFARALVDTLSMKSPAIPETKSTDLPETELAIRGVDRIATDISKSAPLPVSQPAIAVPTPPPVAATPVSQTVAPVAPPSTRVQTVTLAPRKSPVFGFVAVAVGVAATGAAAWYAINRTPTKSATVVRTTTTAPPSTVSPTPNPPPDSTPPLIPPKPPSTGETAQDVARKLKVATAQGDVLYQRGKYDNAIAEYKKALALAPGNGAIQTKIRHSASAKEAEQANAREPAKPRTKAELADLLKNYVPPSRVAGLAQHEGIDFELTPATERELRQAGADDQLIGILGQIAPEPPPADTVSHSEPYIDRAQDLVKAGRFSEALPLIQRSAAGGSADGQRLMGEAYEEGWGVPKDYLRARQWFEKSAAQGNTLAMVRLGTMYAQGWGMPQDYLRAHQWFEKAAAGGNGLAMIRIGDLYERGWGVPQDYTQARLWYEKAAAKKNALAMLRLGNLYERGWGVPKDYKRARQYFEKSAAAGNVNARGRLDELPN